MTNTSTAPRAARVPAVQPLTVDELLSHLTSVRPNGSGWTARCPAHDDKRSSLSITAGDNGRILLHCHAGCSFEAITDALGVPVASLMGGPAEAPRRTSPRGAAVSPSGPSKAATRDRGRIVATYDYTDAAGNLLYQVVRFDPKDFIQRRPDGGGHGSGTPRHWIWGLGKGEYIQVKSGDWYRARPGKDYGALPRETFSEVMPTLFMLPAVIAAIAAGRCVFIVEGEKDVLTLTDAGLVATCNSGGAGKWPKDAAAHFSGAVVVILPDNDDPGRKHADKVARALNKHASEIYILTLPGLAEHGDVSDWFSSGAGGAGHTADDLKAFIADADPWTPDDPPMDTAPAPDVPPEPSPYVEPAAEAVPFRFLGYNDGAYHYLPGEDLQLIRMSPDQHTQAALISLAPLQWWEMQFAAKGGPDWNAARNWMYRHGKAQGIYDSRRLRGCGTWFDEGRVVQHNGDGLNVDGVPTGIPEFPTRYIYNASFPIESEPARALTVSEAHEFLEVCRMPSWEKPISGTLLAGWCVVAPICGALAWRPHIWITGSKGTGKAQPHSAKVLTPKGWRTMGELRVGDYVTTPDNGYGCINNIYPQGKVRVYKLTFADGRQTRATADHLWKVRINGEWRLRTTADIISILGRKPKASAMIAVPLSAPVTISGNNKVILPIHPYVLGALLGDGHFANIGKKNAGQIILTNYDEFIIDKVKNLSTNGITFYDTKAKHEYRMGDLSRYGHKTRETIKELRLLGTRSDTKFIPDEYLYSSIENRIALLQGLMDTDGTIDRGGSMSYMSVSKHLAEGVSCLVRSLGGIAKIAIKHPTFTYKNEHKQGKSAYNVSVRFKDQKIAFSLPRKLCRASSDNQYSNALYLGIKKIAFDGIEESSCIMIDHPDRLYITDDFIVTHNTWIVANMVKPLSGEHAVHAQSNSTEAGIRQTLGINAFPVVLDEVEGEDQSARKRLQGIIELARQASSETGAPIIKGSAGGHATVFLIRSCFALSSIGVNITQRADSSRITVLSLGRHHPAEAEERFRDIQRAVANLITRPWCASLRARSLKLVPVILENSLTFGRIVAHKFADQRIGDQYGALLAGAYALTSNDATTEAFACEWVDQQDWSEQSAIDDDPDERRCVAHIIEHTLSYQVANERVERSIAELLYRPGELSSLQAEVLERVGIRVTVADGKYTVIVSDSHKGISKILRDSPWEQTWGRTLKRLKGAESKPSVRFSGAFHRATVLPHETIFPIESSSL